MIFKKIVKQEGKKKTWKSEIIILRKWKNGNQLYLYVAFFMGKTNLKYESKALQNIILSALHSKQQMTY
jgi:hypothetical protein